MLLLRPRTFRYPQNSHLIRTQSQFTASFHQDTRKPVQETISYNIQLTDRGDLYAARQIFDQIPYPTVASWNALISGHARWGTTEEAFLLASQMQRTNTKLNETTFTSLLAASARSQSLRLGQEIHSLVLKSGFENFRFVGCSLLSLYTSCLQIGDACRLFESLHSGNPLLWSVMLVGFVRCGLMSEALDLFERMPTRNVVSWTALISGFSRRSAGECGPALELFLQMRGSGEAVPNEFTYDSAVRVCAKLEAFDHGKMIHGCLIRCGFESERSIGGALVEFYCNCDAVEDAERVFVQLSPPCLATSNAMIANLSSAGRISDAEMIFARTAEPNAVSYNLLIKAYAQDGRTADSKALFDRMPCKNIVTLNTMISVYHRAGELEAALELFERIKEAGNTVTWNSMISAYIQNEQPVAALKLYAHMLRSSVECSRSTFSAVLRACATTGALRLGKMVHARLSKTPFEPNVYVGTALVDMYAKCGSITDAKASSLRVVSPNVASWTAFINGLAHHGFGVEAILEFGKMLKHGVDPNAVTFVGLILACSREGMADEGMRFFHSMERSYGLTPTVEHYACVVDLLGRSGRVREAEAFVSEMPIEADGVVWVALLNACWFWMDLEVGERVAERTFSLDETHMSTYVVMSNIYAAVGRWEEVGKVRRRLRGLRGKKDPGCSWIEIEGTLHTFCVDDRSHPRRGEIYSLVEELMGNLSSNSEFGLGASRHQMDVNVVPSPSVQYL